MSIAATNQSILRALNTEGTRRADAPSYREASAARLAEVTGLVEAVVTERLDALCVPDRFSDAPLVKVEGGYAQRITMVGFDYHEVRERDDHDFDVRRGRRVVSTHATKDAAATAAEGADHDHIMRHARRFRPVDQRHYDTRVSRFGEPTCYPDR
jgi:hypothetical protein